MKQRLRYHFVKQFLDQRKPETLEDAVELIKTKGFLQSEDENQTYMGTWLEYCFDGDERQVTELFESSGCKCRWITTNHTKSGVGQKSYRISPEMYESVISSTPEGIAFLQNSVSGVKFDWTWVQGEPTFSKEFFTLERVNIPMSSKKDILTKNR